MSTLLRSISNCPCGKPHICPIRRVKIGEGALGALPDVCAGYTHILLVADENTYAACGREGETLLGDAVAARRIFSGARVVIPDETAVAAIEAELTEETDLILGVGSGVINDLCKYVSHRHSLPYVIVATAPSMDGYASAGAAMILGGMKVTPSAAPPMAIVADARVLRDAPMDMIRAGYGDIIGKFSCLNDWRLAAYIRGEYFCEAVYSMVMKTATRIRRLAPEIARRDREAITLLMEALVEVGIAMAYVGSSRPASGSEHHMAHFFEITGIQNGTPYLSHGADVAYASVITARLREQILRTPPHPRRLRQRDVYESVVRELYGEIAPSVIAQQDRLGWYDEPETDAWVLGHIDGIRAILSEAPTEAETRAMVEAVGLSMDEFYTTYGENRIQTAVCWAKDLKDRYSVLWVHNLYYR